jgi:uncharacterized protein
MQQGRGLSGADFLLLLLYLNKREPVRGSTRLIKMIFIFTEEILPLLRSKGTKLSEDALPKFFAYNYGPFLEMYMIKLNFSKT